MTTSTASGDKQQVVRLHFRTLEKPEVNAFSLKLSKKHTYDEVVKSVARHLNLDDPNRIRLTMHNCFLEVPRLQPIKFKGVKCLEDMLIHHNKIADILYYEIVDFPLPRVERQKTLKVAFHHATKDEETIHTITLPKRKTVGDLLHHLKTQVELSHPNAQLRLLEIMFHKILQIIPVHEKIHDLSDEYWTLRAEEIPEEEKNRGPNDRLIQVCHFKNEAPKKQSLLFRNFGDPFLLVIREDERLAEIKPRLQKRLKVEDDEFFWWKFAFISHGSCTYLKDSDKVCSCYKKPKIDYVWDVYIGLNHPEDTSKLIRQQPLKFPGNRKLTKQLAFKELHKS